MLSGIALGYGLDGRGFESRCGLGVFLFITTSRRALGEEGTQPLIQWVPGTLSLGVKRPDREAEYSPPSSAEVKNAWSYTSIPQYTCMAWCSVKRKHKREEVAGEDCIMRSFITCALQQILLG
jgi:hypothetical protein